MNIIDVYSADAILTFFKKQAFCAMLSCAAQRYGLDMDEMSSGTVAVDHGHHEAMFLDLP
jgi:hypothetical protein